MKRLLISLLAVLSLPTNIIAHEEKVNLTENQVKEISANAMFTGSLMTLCLGRKEGFLTRDEMKNLLAFNLALHKGLHNNEAKDMKDKMFSTKKVLEVFPNCFTGINTNK